jgi:hypothetical protein
MSVAELQELEEIKGLIARGSRVGVLTYAEIETATAERCPSGERGVWLGIGSLIVAG